MMKEIPVQEAVGAVLFHDITRIVPGEFDGCAFKKGHVIQRRRRQDITILGHGGLCLSCPECRYPDCSFGV